MIRKIIKIDEERCNGCGLCADACHEGAIGIVEGKAVLLRDDYCDGLGNCLPVCPMDAIHFEEREAAAFDEKAVAEQKKKNETHKDRGCLKQWPVQMKLISEISPCFRDCDLLIAADCTAFSCGNFHERFMKDHVTLIGCTKLDSVDYSDKLAEIIKNGSIRSIHVVRMEVPCCRGMEIAVQTAIEKSQKDVPLKVTVLPINL